jgi:hypothetical protein
MEIESQPVRRRSPFVAAVVAACLGLAALDVALVLRSRGLSARVLELERAVLAARSAELGAGQLIAPLTLLDAEGGVVRVPDPDAGGATLLLVSSGSCEHCDDVAALWEELARSAEGSGLRVLGLVLDATPAELRERAAPWPELAPGPDSWALVRRLPGVPAALLVDDAGLVLEAFYGAPQDGLREALGAHLAPR